MTLALSSRDVMRLKKRMGLGATAPRSTAGGMAIISGLEAALENVPKLDTSNTHTGAVDTFEQVHANSVLSTDGTLAVGNATLDPSNLTAPRTLYYPDADGTIARSEQFTAQAVNLAIASASGTYNATAANCVIYCSGTFTVNLPAANTATRGLLIIKNAGVGTITIDGDGAETIDGAATLALTAGQCAGIISNGSAWLRIIAV